MRLKNIIYSFFIFTLIACDGYDSYQIVRIDSKNQKLEILGDDFVFDSIIIRHKQNFFFKSYLINKNNGVKVLDLSKDIGDYKTERNFYNMCDDVYNDDWKEFSIYIRHKKYLGTSYNQDVDKIQSFEMCYFPCDSEVFILKAHRRH